MEQGINTCYMNEPWKHAVFISFLVTYSGKKSWFWLWIWKCPDQSIVMEKAGKEEAGHTESASWNQEVFILLSPFFFLVQSGTSAHEIDPTISMVGQDRKGNFMGAGEGRSPDSQIKLKPFINKEARVPAFTVLKAFSPQLFQKSHQRKPITGERSILSSLCNSCGFQFHQIVFPSKPSLEPPHLLRQKRRRKILSCFLRCNLRTIKMVDYVWPLLRQ